jgi:hypothetical protein
MTNIVELGSGILLIARDESMMGCIDIDEGDNSVRTMIGMKDKYEIDSNDEIKRDDIRDNDTVARRVCEIRRILKFLNF